jgi:hypothetical protein
MRLRINLVFIFTFQEKGPLAKASGLLCFSLLRSGSPPSQMEIIMPKPSFLVNNVDIASANLGWLLSQILLSLLVREKIITQKDAREALEFCQRSMLKGSHPQRAPIRAAAAECLPPLIAQYADKPSGQTH